MDPLYAACIGLAIAGLWDYGRRWLVLRNAEAAVHARFKDSVDRTEKLYHLTDDRITSLNELYNSLHRVIAELTKDHTTGEAVKAQIIAIQRSVHEAIEVGKTCGKEFDSMSLAIRTLGERCDKNSLAITNTAESMQKLLNEKFTAIALKQAVNQRTG